jgi:outer membrane protein OmpA-like peptidoglycan-associated protein
MISDVLLGSVFAWSVNIQTKFIVMKNIKNFVIMILSASLLLSGCATMNKTQQGALIGVVAGGALGAAIGHATGNTAAGAAIGVAVGGATGAVIGRRMDKQAEELKNSVPDAKVERVGEGIVVEFNNSVLFGFDQSALSTPAIANLNQLQMVLTNYPDTNLEIQGHTDAQGSESYNLTLSEKRAKAVADYLISRGINASRITIKPMGESVPKYSNETSEGRSQNRRVEFVITANEKMKADAAREAGV